MRILFSLLIVCTLSTTLCLSTNALAEDTKGREHTVQAGQSLSALAEKYYKDHLAWPAIFEATNDRAKSDSSFTEITDPEAIFVGQKLWIPDESEVARYLEEAEIRGDITAHGKEEVHWGYEGENGPANWGKLDRFFALCEDGKKQSPINLTSPTTKNLSEILFNYNPSTLKILNNGHTIQLNYDEGSTIEIGKRTYSLLQFHFHTPSEHTVNDNFFPMEMHLVHSDAGGNLAVIGVMFKEGEHNENLGDIWQHLPEEEQPEQSIDISINALDLLPQSVSTYRYVGSLTTPPCSENVSWHVMKSAVEVSADQLQKFKDIFEINNRPVQPLNDRTIVADE